MQEEFEGPSIFDMLLGSTRSYCGIHTNHLFESRQDFADKCGLAPKCRDWLYASPTEFVPFNSDAPTNFIVLTFHYGRKYASVRSFTKGELSIRPED